MCDKFFVYGTLKVGGYFAKKFDALRTSNKPAKLKGFDLYRIGSSTDSWFPGVIPGDGVVTGELHEYDKKATKEVLTGMDRIEGFDPKNPKHSFYRREIVKVTLEDGTEEDANGYIFNSKMPKEYPKVKSGTWTI